MAVAAERGAQLAVDQPVEQRVLERSAADPHRRLSWAWLHSIAVFAAISKIRPLPSLRAFCSAVL